MPYVRKILFWIHLVVGLVAGLVILVMAITGVAMTYEQQLIGWADGIKVSPPAEKSVILPETLLKENPKQDGNAPTALTIHSDANKPASLQFGREKMILINPYTGESLGEGNVKVRSFFKWNLSMHRWLSLQGASQETGKRIIGFSNIVFLFLLFSGLYLWFPKRFTRVGLKAITMLRFGAKGRARDWNWHNVFGFWAALPLLVISLTGLVMSQHWANDVLFRMVGDKAPPREEKKRGEQMKPAHSESLSGINAAFDFVRENNPSWQSVQLQLPVSTTALFTVSDSHRGRPDKRRQVTVDLTTNKVIKSEGFEALPAGRRARTWVRWIHTGEVGGLLGQALAGLASLAVVILVWTGFALSWRRFTNRKKKLII